VVDITGELPVILMELNLTDSSLKKTYIYGNSQILAQHTGGHTAARYFYLHDRLGSVRLIMNGSGTVVKDYTYEPFGEVINSGGTFNNSFMFTGQYFDSEIEEYYLRARQYNPHIGRFASRDPVDGEFQEPLTLHKYLYCGNDPIDNTDPTGERTKEETLTSTAIGAGIDASATTAAVALAYWATQQLLEQMQVYQAVLSLAAASERYLDAVLAHFSRRSEEFRGGKIGTRDSWGGLENKPEFPKFRRWFEKVYKRFFKGQDFSKEDLYEAYDEFMKTSKNWKD